MFLGTTKKLHETSGEAEWCLSVDSSDVCPSIMHKTLINTKHPKLCCVNCVICGKIFATALLTSLGSLAKRFSNSSAWRKGYIVHIPCTFSFKSTDTANDTLDFEVEYTVLDTPSCSACEDISCSMYSMASMVAPSQIWLFLAGL